MTSTASAASTAALRAADRYDAVASNGTTATATNLTTLINPTGLTALVNGLDITTTTDLDYYKFVAPVGLSGTTTIGVVSEGLSLLSPRVSIYNAAGTSLGTLSSTNYGATLSLTVGGLTAGQTYYVKVDGVDATAFGTGAYALTLNFGTGSSPTPSPCRTRNSRTETRSGQVGARGSGSTRRPWSTPTPPGTARRATRVPGRWRWTPTATSSSPGRATARTAAAAGVYAQRYDAAGVPQGGEFRVNTTTAGDQDVAAVAMDADGDFVVAWQSDGQDGSGCGVYAQRYSAAGVAQGGEFRVNTYHRRRPDRPGGGDGRRRRLRRRLGELRPGRQRPTASTPSGTTPPASPRAASSASTPSTAGDQADPAGGDGRRRRLRRRLGRATARTAAAAASTPSGSTPPAWPRAASSASTPPPPATRTIPRWRWTPTATSSSPGRARPGRQRVWRRLRPAVQRPASAQGGEFRVNTTTAEDQQYSSVAMDADGDFVVTWSSNQKGKAGSGIYRRQYLADGRDLGERCGSTPARTRTSPIPRCGGGQLWPRRWSCGREMGPPTIAACSCNDSISPSPTSRMGPSTA